MLYFQCRCWLPGGTIGKMEQATAVFISRDPRNHSSTLYNLDKQPVNYSASVTSHDAKVECSVSGSW